jgi:hypothetical protein
MAASDAEDLDEGEHVLAMPVAEMLQQAARVDKHEPALRPDLNSGCIHEQEGTR